MPDLVVTVPKNLWWMWLNEGDAAGSPPSGEEWGWYLGGGPRPPVERGDRLYIVAWSYLRGYAPVTRLVPNGKGWVICREGGAVACTIDETIPGFRGWRKVWWPREAERPFPEWKTAGLPGKPCDLCGGSGQVNAASWSFDGDSDRMIPDEPIPEPCDECGGRGFIRRAA